MFCYTCVQDGERVVKESHVMVCAEKLLFLCGCQTEQAHSHENGAIFNLIFHKHTTTEIGWQFAYKQHFLKVSNTSNIIYHW